MSAITMLTRVVISSTLFRPAGPCAHAQGLKSQLYYSQRLTNIIMKIFSYLSALSGLGCSKSIQRTQPILILF